MGYESRLYVVAKSDIKSCGEDNNLFYAEKLAAFNLCKTPQTFLDGILYLGEKTDCALFIDDEETNQDKYGDVMKEFSLEDMIKILENCIADSNSGDYRRWRPCLAMLEGFRMSELKGEWGDALRVLHYGY